jgi:hypothetical protein
MQRRSPDGRELVTSCLNNKGKNQQHIVHQIIRETPYWFVSKIHVQLLHFLIYSNQMRWTNTFYYAQAELHCAQIRCHCSLTIPWCRLYLEGPRSRQGALCPTSQGKGACRQGAPRHGGAHGLHPAHQVLFEWPMAGTIDALICWCLSDNDLNLGNLKFVLDDSVFMYRIIPEWSLNPLSIHHQEFSTTRK